MSEHADRVRAVLQKAGHYDECTDVACPGCWDDGSAEKAKADLDALLSQISQFRELLWLHHGCPFSVLYKDDGHMQCPRCFIDFKKDDPLRIREMFRKKASLTEKIL